MKMPIVPGFAKLIPAFTTHIVLDPTISVASVSSGTTLTIAPFIKPTSYLVSEPAYPISVHATFIQGSDYSRSDPDGKHYRLNVNSVLRDVSGAMIVYHYTGMINVTKAVKKIFAGDPTATSTDFGDVFTHITFETGSNALRALEHKLYVGSGRFLVEAGAPLVVEYTISEIVLGDGDNYIKEEREE